MLRLTLPNIDQVLDVFIKTSNVFNLQADYAKYLETCSSVITTDNCRNNTCKYTSFQNIPKPTGGIAFCYRDEFDSEPTKEFKFYSDLNGKYCKIHSY
jgi:hypothetical protein